MIFLYLAILMSILCCAPLPECLWNEWAWALQDAQTFFFAGAAAKLIPYSCTKEKAVACVLAFWRLLVIPMNALDLAPIVNAPLAVLVAAVVSLYVLRCCLEPHYVERTEDHDNGHFALLEIRTVWGLLQNTFLFWRPAMVETKCALYQGRAWVLHKGRFKKVHLSICEAKRQGATVISHGAPFSSSELKRLDALVGKKSFPVLRACSRVYFL